MSAPASTQTPSDSASAIESALRRAVLYEALAMSLMPPSESTFASIALIEHLEGPAGKEEKVREPLERARVDLVRASNALHADALASEHDRIFGHTAQGLVSPYETEYGPSDAFRQAEEIADVGGFYRAFGLGAPASGHERQDHIALELEFLSFLACKEAYELNAGRPECLEATRNAQRLFLRDHVGRFGRAFARALVRESRHSFYRAAGELCSEVLARDAEAFGVALGPELLPVRVLAEDSTPMACGGCALSELRAGDVGEDPSGADAC